MEVSILGVSWPPCPFPVSVQQEAGVVKMTERLSLFSSTEDHSLCQLGHLLKAVSSFIPKDDSLKTQIGPLGNGDDLRKVDIPVSRWKWIVKKGGGAVFQLHLKSNKYILKIVQGCLLRTYKSFPRLWTLFNLSTYVSSAASGAAGIFRGCRQVVDPCTCRALYFSLWPCADWSSNTKPIINV